MPIARYCPIRLGEFEGEELGLPGYGWDKANGNVLIPSTPAEPGYGATPMRSSLVKIYPGRGDL